MRATLSSRIALVVTLIIGLGVSLTVMLNYFKLAQTLAAVAESRLAFTASDLRSRIESGLDLGLDLSSMANVQAIVDDEAADDPKILAITVFDADGRVLFGAGDDVAASDSTVPDAWRQAAERSPDWRAEAPGVLIVGTQLTNDFGGVAGGVALMYARAALDQLLSRALAVLVPVGIALLLLSVLLAWVIAAALFRGTERRLRGMREAVESVLEPSPQATGAPSDPELDRTRERLSTVLAEIRAASGRLAALGERA